MDSMVDIDRKTLNDLKKSLRITRLLCAVCAVVSILLLAGFVLLYVKASPMLESAKALGPVMESLKEIDKDAISDAMSIFADKSVDWKGITKNLRDLDIKKINNTLNQLDVEGLNRSITRINEALESVSGVLDKLKGLGNLLH